MRQTVKFAMTAMAVMVGVCATAPVFAQTFDQVAPQGQPARAQAPAAPSLTAPARMPAPQGVTPAAASAPQTPTPRMPDPRIDQSDVNIKLTITIKDSTASGTQTKVVSLIIANKGSGRVRSSGISGPDRQGSELNVDGRASLLKNGSISTSITINYTPERTDEPSKLTSVSQSVDLYLKDGTPTVITQAADPTKGSRSISIEATASVMK